MRLILLSLITIVSLSACREGAAEDAVSTVNEKPYKATTVDECIQEKECVWHHFLLATQDKSENQDVTENINIKKWIKPVRIRVVGNPKKITLQNVVNYLNEIDPYMLQDVSLDNKYNYLIVFTDSIEGELNGEYKNILDGRLLAGYNEARSNESNKCFYFYAQDMTYQNNIYAYFAFIQNDHPDIESCLKEVVYSGTGLKNIKHSSLFVSSRHEKFYSKLELLIIYFLYQDYFIGGMSIEQSRQAFDIMYESVMKSMKKQGII